MRHELIAIYALPNGDEIYITTDADDGRVVKVALHQKTAILLQRIP